jgi:hypothetical protein
MHPETKNPAFAGFFDNVFFFCKDVPGDPHQDRPRTFERLLAVLTTAYTRQQLPDLSTVACFAQREVETAPVKYNFQVRRKKEG